MDTKDLAQKLVRQCLAKGADAAEVYLATSRSLSLQVRNGEVETMEEAASKGLGLRVYVGGRLGFAASNDLRPASLTSAVSRAVAYARATTADPSNVLAQDKGITLVDGLFDPALAKVTLEEKITRAKELERLAMQDKRVTKSSGAGYFESEYEAVIVNSHGLAKAYASTGCGFNVSVVAEKGEQKSSGDEGANRRFYRDLPPLARLAERAADKAIRMLDPRPVKTQKAAVVFDPEAASALLGGLLMAVNGERVLQGASFLGGKLGQRIASPLVTLVDDGTRPGGLSSAPFDAEGVPTQRRAIVEQGVLRSFMYDTAIAKRAGTQSTGNATRGDYASLPTIGAHQFHMLAGPHKREDILLGTPNGLLFTEVTGLGINPVNGDFSAGAAGFWIEDGKVVFPVQGLAVAGNAFEMLASIDQVADDLDLYRGMTAPTFRIPSLQIGGA